MAETKTKPGFQGSKTSHLRPMVSVVDLTKVENTLKAKEMLKQVSAEITENITRYGYKEDKVVLTLLNGAIELL